jgi:hypothetical protein
MALIVTQLVKKFSAFYGSWNLSVHYRVRNRPPLVSVLSQMHQVHTVPSYFRKVKGEREVIPVIFLMSTTP